VSSPHASKIALAFALLAAFLILIVFYFRAKPVALHNITSRAAAAISLSWDLLEPEITVSTRIYRTTNGFLSDPDDQYKIAELPAPADTYTDTTVSAVSKYYYSIFQVDIDGQIFDPSYAELTPTIFSDPPPVSLRGIDINCSGTVFYVNHSGTKEGYPSAEVFFLWNNSFANVQTRNQSECDQIPTAGLVFLPQGTLIKVPGAPTVWQVEGTTARPIASLSALYRISANPKIISVSIPYLHSHYSGGAIIY
jgi:hypothetical protein